MIVVGTNVSLGMMVRAMRMGFGLSKKHAAFVRLSGGKGAPFRCELHPLGLIPISFKSHELHYCWWPDGESFSGLDLDGIERLRNIRKVKRPFSFYFNEHGKTQ